MINKVSSFVLVLFCLLINIDAHAVQAKNNTTDTFDQQLKAQDWSTELIKFDNNDPKNKRKAQANKKKRKTKRTVRQKIRQREIKKIPIHKTIQHHSRRFLSAG